MLFTKSEIENKRKKIATKKKMIIGILYIILIPILIYNLFMIAQTMIKPNKTPSVFGIKSFVIVSGSMQPDIKIGDMVVSKEVAEEEIKIGDIISFKKGNSVVTHRIIEISVDENGEKQYITKGDNNNTKDAGSVKYNEVEGKIIKNIPYIGNIAVMLQNKTIIAIIITLFIIYLLFRLKKEKKVESRNDKRLAYTNKI